MGVTVKKELLEIKDIIRKPLRFRNFNNEADQIVAQLSDLHSKIDQIHEKLLTNKDSSATLKRKKQIIAVLKQSRQLTSSEVGLKLKLSRTRCSEYLNDLSKEGIVENFTKGRKKYFRVMEG